MPDVAFRRASFAACPLRHCSRALGGSLNLFLTRSSYLNACFQRLSPCNCRWGNTQHVVFASCFLRCFPLRVSWSAVGVGGRGGVAEGGGLRGGRGAVTCESRTAYSSAFHSFAVFPLWFVLLTRVQSSRGWVTSEPRAALFPAHHYSVLESCGSIAIFLSFWSACNDSL